MVRILGWDPGFWRCSMFLFPSQKLFPSLKTIIVQLIDRFDTVRLWKHRLLLSSFISVCSLPGLWLFAVLKMAQNCYQVEGKDERKRSRLKNYESLKSLCKENFPCFQPRPRSQFSSVKKSFFFLASRRQQAKTTYGLYQHLENFGDNTHHPDRPRFKLKFLKRRGRERGGKRNEFIFILLSSTSLTFIFHSYFFRCPILAIISFILTTPRYELVRADSKSAIQRGKVQRFILEVVHQIGPDDSFQFTVDEESSWISDQERESSPSLFVSKAFALILCVVKNRREVLKV